MLQTLIDIGERFSWPDMLTQPAIKWLVGKTRRKLRGAGDDVDRRFAADMAAYPIAMNVEAANAQHYEMPQEFFALALGPQRKYSCCFYDHGIDSLGAAEERALQVTAAHAALGNGQRILELGCGWGALSLWMARHYPAAQITAVSNSQSQRAFISGAAAMQGLTNLEVVTA